MADLSKFKGRGTLGAPPPPSEASTNLRAPEIAPSLSAALAPPMVEEEPAGIAVGRRVRDGRSARRTGRVIQFATRVTPDFDDRFRAIAERDGLLHVELLEKALAAYEASLARGKR